MPTPRVLFINVGWMTAYKGLEGDRIIGGGGYVKKHGFGHEIFNFKPYEGRCYGYGRAANDAIALERLGAAKADPFVDGVLVVWVASSHVVGWYENARVYRNWQAPPPGSNRFFRHEECWYYVAAKTADCKLLDPDARTLAVPRAREVEGGMGRYVWYAEGPQHQAFLNRLSDFIQCGGKADTTKAKSKPGGGGGGWQTDPQKRKRIEQAAIGEVKQYYLGLGYRIGNRQDDHCGWDLDATRGNRVLQLEVKGVSGGRVLADLTANEYKHMRMHRDSYRVCIVTNALSKKPKLSIYGYVAGSKQWKHHQDGTPLLINVVWVQSARLCA